MGENDICARTENQDLATVLFHQDDSSDTGNKSETFEFSEVTLKLSARENPENIALDGLPLDQELTLIVGLSDCSLLSLVEGKLFGGVSGGELSVTAHAEAERTQWLGCAADCTSSHTPDCQQPGPHACQHRGTLPALRLAIQVLSNTPAPSVLRTSTQEKLDRAHTYKDLGTTLFKSGNISLAFSKYRRALQYLILIQKSIESDVPSRCDEHRALRMQCYLNMAACQMTHKAWDHVISNCSKVLAMEQANVKALYRRARAYEQRQEYELAERDLEAALEQEPDNKALEKYLSNLRQQARLQHAALTRRLGNMFSS